ncbi:rhamnogalacturonan acetylesterase [Epilithonimonas hungarica]|uniref:Lysophospholipase L1 n=1 Tax=Epilithonimonas hungarica TaxID=454006 RepID=A0A1G7UCU5_9FLAO|nr:rhamnogalacturonan acetylesterase [Epilithonimonas hungarica]SDG45412.1 Lysophospholipase L1 [Epilithonimonas hungarica]
MNKKLSIIFLFLSLMIWAQKPTLFLIGDSTMSNKDNPDKNPEHGWGQVLPQFFTSGIEIQNLAMNGRSSKSFRTEGRWDKIEKQLKKGDFVIIQFGHNDQKLKDSTKFTNPYTQYRANLERYVNETRAKGATPILMTSITRRNFNENGVLIDTHKEYSLVVKLVADAMKVSFVDMQLLTEQMEISAGPEKSKLLHLHFKAGENPYYNKDKADDTHLSRFGAESVAKLAVKALKPLNIGLEKYIK